MFPQLQLGFQTSKAAGAELKGQAVTFLREKEKGGGGWLGREGGREGVLQEWSFFFSPFTLLSLEIFNLNQNQVPLPGEQETDSKDIALKSISQLLLFFL